MGPGLSGLVMYRRAMGDEQRKRSTSFWSSALVKLRGERTTVRAVGRRAERPAPRWLQTHLLVRRSTMVAC